MGSFFDNLLEDETILTDDSNLNNETELDSADMYTIKQKLSSIGFSKDDVSVIAMRMSEFGVKNGLKWGETNGFFDAYNKEIETPNGIMGAYYINDIFFTKYFIDYDF